MEPEIESRVMNNLDNVICDYNGQNIMEMYTLKYDIALVNGLKNIHKRKIHFKLALPIHVFVN